MASPLGNGRFHNTHRISAVFPYPPLPDAEDVLDSITDCKRIVVMDEVKLRENRALITSLAVQNGFDAVLFTEDVIDGCDYTVKTPMARGIDSLNVGKACAIALYELTR